MCPSTTIVKKCDIAGFTLTETLYPPSLHLPKHAHERASFSLILRGGFHELYGTKDRVCERSMVVFLPSNETHSDRFHPTGCHGFHFELAPQWLARISPCLTVLQRSVDFRGGVLNNLAVKLYSEFREIDVVTPLAVEGLVFEIIAELARRSLHRVADGRRPVAEARDFLHAHFREEISLAQVADKIGLHPVYLARAFRKHYQCSVGEYVRRLRIEFAGHELSISDAPLAQVAQNAGFFDQSHFSRIFKLATGMTPAAYRKLLRAG